MVTKGDLIQYLNRNSTQLHTTKLLAIHFGVTQRTIQTYIRQLREEYPDAIEVKQRGVLLTKPITWDKKQQLFLTYADRKSYILRNLLVNQCSLDVYELAQTLCISEITLQNEIKRIRRSLETYRLQLKTKQNQLFINGDTKDKKALIINLIYGEAQHALVSLATLNGIFQQYDAEIIRDILLQKLNQAHFFIDEYSLINLLLHILIAMDQSPGLITLPYEDVHQEFVELNHHFVSIIDEVCLSLEQRYQIQFSASNRYQFTLLLMTRAIRNKEIKRIDQHQLSVSQEILALVQHIIDEVYEMFTIDLHTDEFMIAFTLHLKNMLIRLKKHISIHNPLLYNIKSTSPFIYDIAVFISNLISKEQQVEVYDDEIAYIALHIGARIEEINSTRDKLQAILVCPQYYSYQNKQFKRMEAYFHDDMLITSIVTNPVLLDAVSCDFIISTIPLDQAAHVLISNFFNDADKEAINSTIKSLKQTRARKKTMELLSQLIDEDLFTPIANFTSKDEAIHSMASKLIQKGYVGEEYTAKIVDREAISSTNFGMIAVPHPIDYYAKKTVIEVVILQHAISWGNTDVKIIFMFCISKLDFASFSDVFSFLAGTCSNQENLECLASSKSYQAFMKNISALYE